MRIFQIAVFALGLAAFALAAIEAGKSAGDVYWRTGMAMMLGDLVVMRLWPTSGRPAEGPSPRG